MTQDEKFTAIVDRLKLKSIEIDPTHISAMVIVGYLDDLAKKGLIESAYALLPNGKTVRAICEEFDWKPSDDEIKAFVISMVDPGERVAFAYMVKRYRDDREKFLEEFDEFKKAQQGE